MAGGQRLAGELSGCRPQARCSEFHMSESVRSLLTLPMVTRLMHIDVFLPVDHFTLHYFSRLDESLGLYLSETARAIESLVACCCHIRGVAAIFYTITDKCSFTPGV